MLVAEQCFCEINNAPVRRIRGRVELYNGSTLLNTFRHTDLLKSFSIERIGETDKFFGYGVCQKINAKVLDRERQLNITTANTLDAAFGVGCDFIYCYPYFKVSEVHRDETTNELSITGYDALYNAAQYTITDLQLAADYTLADVARECGRVLGLPLNDVPSGFDILYNGGANFEGNETVREALNAVAEATQTIYYIDNEQRLTFKRLDVAGDAVAAITNNDYFELDSSTNRRLATICHTTELGDNVSISTTESGTTQYIRDNPFWELREDIAALLETALAAAGGLTINQFECKWRGNYLLEIGDKISITNKDGTIDYSFVLDDVISYDGSFKETTKWKYENSDTETEANPTNLGESLKQTYARVDKANKQIAMVASELEATNSSISSLIINTDTITGTVETATQTLNTLNEDITTLTERVNASITATDLTIAIQNELSTNGVASITTETGYTFNNEGLTVAKSDTEMKTTISDDGMTVYKEDEAVLLANNVGVDAINLHATTYLIIGTNSRFENYGSDRTGCFWIGEV